MTAASYEKTKHEAMKVRSQSGVRRPLRVILGVVVIALVGALVFIGVTTTRSKPAARPVATGTGGRAPEPVVRAVTQVNASVLNNIDLPNAGLLVPPRELSGWGLLKQDGKPEVLYMGALYCSQCAAERWPLAIALSRFGTLTGLRVAESAAKPEAYPHTPTLSFQDATYKSKYIEFVSIEMQSDKLVGHTGYYATLEKPTKAEVELYDALDVSANGQTGGEIPFVDYGNEFAQVEGANYSPGLLKGLTPEGVARLLQAPTSKVAQAVFGSADVVTAMICVLTDGSPADVCNGKAVRMALSGVESSQSSS